MTLYYDQPIIQPDGSILVIVRDDKGNIVGSNLTVTNIDEPSA